MVWTASIFIAKYERFWIWLSSKWAWKWNTRWDFEFDWFAKKWTKIWIREGSTFFYPIHDHLCHSISHFKYFTIFTAYRNTVMATVQSFQMYFFQHLAIICWKLFKMNVCQEKSILYYTSKIKIKHEISLPQEIFIIYYCFQCRAGARVQFFGRNADAWGKIFSLREWTAKLFPKLSGFDMLREAAMKFYDSIKVILRLFPLQFSKCQCRVGINSFLFFYIGYHWWAIQNIWSSTWTTLLGYVF